MKKSKRACKSQGDSMRMLLSAMYMSCLVMNSETPITPSQKIISLITNLYQQKNTDFLYSYSIPVESPQKIELMKQRYSKYYSPTIVKLIIERAKESGDDPRTFFHSDYDPRFAKEGNLCEQRQKIIKLIVNEPVIDAKKATIKVEYQTDQTGNNIYSTIYYLEQTQTGWKIYDQWLGDTVYKPNNHPDLEAALRASEKN